MTTNPTERPVELPWFPLAEQAIRCRTARLTLLAGEPGGGKTTFVHFAARRATGRPPVVVAGGAGAGRGQLFGRWRPAGREARFEDGALAVALKADAWLLVEELDRLPPAGRAALLHLRDRPEVTNPLTSEVLPVPPRFRLVATTSRRPAAALTGALRDGFLVVRVPGLTPDQVRRVLRHHFPDADADALDRVMALWQHYRGLARAGGGGRPAAVGYRAAAQLLALLEAGVPEPEAVQVALANRLGPVGPGRGRRGGARSATARAAGPGR